MIALSVNKSYPELYQRCVTKDGRVRYDPNNELNRQILYECACLQWPMEPIDILNHIEHHGYYYCAVRSGVVQEVFEMNHEHPYITMQQAIDERVINFDNGQYGIVKGFVLRQIGMLRVDIGLHNNYDLPDYFEEKRVFFYQSRLADDKIRQAWRDKHIPTDRYGIGFVPMLFDPHCKTLQ